jgi:hypothetical protein
MHFSRMSKFSAMTALSAGFLLSLAACSDSTGPGNLDSNAALQSLSLGVAGLADASSPAAGSLSASLGVIAPLLDKVNVTINGKSQTMFALGVRESFPDGTCEETLFGLPPDPLDPGACTPPSLGELLILWQSHSQNAAPDRIIVIAADEGTSNFEFISSDLTASPALAIYLDGQNPDNVMLSETGSLTSQVVATGATCAIPLPPYAKAATCSIATFDEQGTISFSPFTDTPNPTETVVTIPRQTLHGLWEAITETQPVSLNAVRALIRSRSRSPERATLLSR